MGISHYFPGLCVFSINELSLVEETVKLLRGNSSLTDFRVLNCGFGLGIVRESSVTYLVELG